MNQPSQSTEPELAQPAKKASLLHVVRIVVSLLFMIGRNRDSGPQAPVITPARLIVVSLVGAALLAAGLVLLASFIARGRVRLTLRAGAGNQLRSGGTMRSGVKRGAEWQRPAR